MKRIIFLMLGWGLCLIVQAQTTNFSKLNFGCDGRALPLATNGQRP